MSQNPLLAPLDDLIDYAAIRPEHIEPAIDSLLSTAKEAVDKVAETRPPLSWENLIEPLETASQPLWRSWSVVRHLNAVVNTPELREAYNRCLPKITQFSTWVGLHKGLYKQYQTLANSADFAQLSPTRQRIIELALRDFRLGGVELEGEKREIYAKISDEQAQLSQKFSENTLDAMDAWSLHVSNEADLKGLPSDVIQAARERAQEKGQDGWLLNLQMPCYLPVMQYAQNRSIRESLYRGYGTLASDQGDTRFDNSEVIEQLLALRAQEAQLLGYPHYAQIRLETRMADTAPQVLEFLRELAQKAKPYAERDLAELQAFAAEHYQLDTLEPWDIPFMSERLREQRYSYSEEEVKQYFSEPQMFDGLFTLAKQLFEITLRPLQASVWHADVQAFEVLSNEALIGYLYVDMYARQGKQSGAWVSSERSRRRLQSHLQLPIIYLTCNFTAPTGDQPALLTHNDVITLFHESGHALHALASQIDEPAASAFAAVEWDAIELPSQFMENFCWEWSVVKGLSAHVKTGKAISRELFDKLLAARNFQSGMQMVRQIEFALFDMLIHQQENGLSIVDVLQTLDEVRNEVAVVFPPSWHRFPHNFSHLFAGGYAAGYYSYKWAEVLSADAYAAFEEAASADGTNTTVHANTGKRFRDEVLAVGGARPAAESFRAFRGRDAKLDALLRHSGMADDEVAA